MMISVNLWHNEKTQYGIATHLTRRLCMTGTAAEIERMLAQYADNADSVKIVPSVSAVSINTDDRFLFQVAGYSPSRGMYCDVIPA